MLRFLFAGFATVGGVVLLFFLSFANVRGTWQSLEHQLIVPVQKPSLDGNESRSVPSQVAKMAQPEARTQPSSPAQQQSLQREIMALQARLHAADQTMASLHSHAEQQRQQLALLQQQHSADQSQVAQLRQQQAAAAVAVKQAKVQQQEAAQELLQARTQQQSAKQAESQALQQEQEAKAQAEKGKAQQTAEGAAESAAEAKARALQEAAEQEIRQARTQQQTAEQAERQWQEQEQTAKAEAARWKAQEAAANSVHPDAASQAQVASPTTQENSNTALRSPTQPVITAQTESSTRHVPASRTVAKRQRVHATTATRQAMPDARNPDSLSAVLARLQRETAANEQPRPAPSPASTGGAARKPPPITPSRRRLERARSAILQGRLQEAQQLLEEAQLQLVFRPVGPDGEASSSGSQAATDVAQALSMLGAGRTDDALHDVDRAMADIGRPRQQASFAPERWNSYPGQSQGWPPPGYQH